MIGQLSREMVGMERGGSRDRAEIAEFTYISSILAAPGGRRPSRLRSHERFARRPRLLSAPAEASCSQSNQTISSPTTSTKQSNGGNITITSGGSITTNLGIILLSTPTGCSAGTINNAGSINYSTYGVFNQNSVTTLTNSGTIAGSTATRNGGLAIISTGTIQALTTPTRLAAAPPATAVWASPAAAKASPTST